jgi:hypothetical protein
MTEISKKEDELALLAVDAAMAILSLSSRKQALKKQLSIRIKDEKGILID